MDRLALFKALADGSRYAIYQELLGADQPLSVTELAARLELHPNTVRPHLERLRDVGLVDMAPDRHGAVGRPQHRWSLSSESPPIDAEPDAWRLLAHLLAETTAGGGAEPADLAAVGRAAGRDRVTTGPLSRQAAAGDRAQAPGGAERRRRGGRPACLQAFVDELAALGFDPAVELARASNASEVPAVAFLRCPFRDLAARYPDLVCGLHRGMTEGILEAVAARTGHGRAAVSSFSTLLDEDPCRVELALAGSEPLTSDVR